MSIILQFRSKKVFTTDKLGEGLQLITFLEHQKKPLKGQFNYFSINPDILKI